jgi:hypothetical protein
MQGLVEGLNSLNRWNGAPAIERSEPLFQKDHAVESASVDVKVKMSPDKVFT